MNMTERDLNPRAWWGFLIISKAKLKGKAFSGNVS